MIKSYTVYVKSGEDLLVEYIPEAFNMYAFLLGMFWLLYNKLWAYGIIFATIIFMLKYIGDIALIGSGLAIFAIFVSHIILGFMANDFIRARLQREGYVFHDVVVGSSEGEAEVRFVCLNIMGGEKNAH